MDLKTLSIGLDQVAPSGVVLSVERRVALQASLQLLKNAEKFARVVYWGKVTGIAADYYVAQGQGSDPFSAKSFYSMDCIKWAQLPEVPEVLQKSCLLVRGRFTGSPSHETTVEETGPSSDEERPELPEDVASLRVEDTKGDGTLLVTTRIPEELRLAAVVKAIDADTRVVPRGVFRKSPAGVIEESSTFHGLQPQEAVKLQNYLHRRTENKLDTKNTMELAKLEPSLDFMDNLSDDIPRGVWSIQAQHGSNSVVLRSMLWPGFVFYHMPNSTNFGGIYTGTGLANKDLVFMLP